MHGRLKTPKTSPQAVEVYRRWSGQAHSHWPGGSLGNEGKEIRCAGQVLPAPFVVSPLRVIDRVIVSVQQTKRGV